MDGEQELAPVARQPLPLVWGEIPEDLLGRRGEDPDRAGAARRLLEAPEGRRPERTPLVPDPGEEECHLGVPRGGEVAELREPLRIGAEVGLDRLAVAARVERREEPRAVRPLPDPERERDRRGSPKLAAEPELLGREPDHPGVGGNRRQVEGEAEAVGQEEVARAPAERLLEEALAVEDLADERLGRGQDAVHRLPARPGRVPATGRHGLGDLREELRMVLPEQPVPVRPFEAQRERRKRAERLPVLADGAGQEVADRARESPPPLAVEVGDGDDVERGPGR
ncbi:MAG: hypothetical protein M5U13_06120 [Thermoanaerobaculia bacterium]|nr:hypothetical protein [Thermoanaerobaculia bacterium]